MSAEIEFISREHLKAFCYHYKIAFLELSEFNDLLSWNELARKLFNCKEKCPVGVNFIDYCQQQQIACPVTNLTSEQEKGQPCLLEYAQLDGIVFRWHMVRLAKYPSHLFLLGKSVDYAQAMPDVLLRRDTYFIDHLPLLIYAKDMKGNYMRANQTAKFFANHTLVGFNDQEVLSHEVKKLYHGVPQRDMEDETAPTSQEMRSTGMQAHMNLSKKVPLLDKLGKLCGFLFIEVPSLSLPKRTLPGQPMDKSEKVEPLTPQEKRCVRWMVKGKSAEQIGLILGLSKRTIESIFAQLKRKSGVKNMFQLGCHMRHYFEDELMESD